MSVQSEILVLFAVSHEAEEFIACCEKMSSTHLLANAEMPPIKKICCELGRKKLFIACLGMGAKSVSANLPAVLDSMPLPPSLVVMAGYAGAIVAGIKKGEVFVCGVSPEVFGGAKLKHPIREGVPATVSEVLDTPDKKTLCARNTGAMICDMELGIVREICALRNIPVASVRSVSDVFDDVLPIKALGAAFDAEKQRPTPLRLLLRLADNPSEIVPFFKFVSGLSHARKNLAGALKVLIGVLP